MTARRGWRPLGCVLGGALTVTGCVSPAPVPEPAAVTGAGVARTPTPNPPREAAVRPPVRQKPAPAARLPSVLSGIEQLVGMEAGAIAKLFGEPALLRHEPPAQVWLYTGPTCVLHLFLYSEAGAQTYRVRHAEVRGRDLAMVAPPTRCLEAVVTEAAAQTH